MSEAMTMIPRSAEITANTRERVLIYMLGVENERLNQGLEDMRRDSERKELEIAALRRALKKTERERDAACAQNREYRAERLEAWKDLKAEETAHRANRHTLRWAIAALVMIGIAGGIAVAYGIMCALGA